MPTTSIPLSSITTIAPLAGCDHVAPLASEEARLQARIAALQTKQRRQQLKEDLSPPIRKSRTGIRFASAFLIVMGIHVAAIGGFYGLSMLHKMRDADHLALKAHTPAYAGIPDKTTSKSPPISQNAAEPTSKKPQELVAASLPVPETTPAHSKRKKVNSGTHSLKVTPHLKTLFTRNHTSASSAASTKAIPTTQPVSTRAETLTTQGHPEAENIAAKNTQLISRTSPTPLINYSVGPGDTLSKVAIMMGVAAEDIRKANGLRSGNGLQVGQTLKIPSTDTHHPLQLVQIPQEETVSKPEAPELFTPKMDRIAPNGVYTVKKGDNPYSVARCLGVSFAELMVANAITNPADIKVGQHLRVPEHGLAAN